MLGLQTDVLHLAGRFMDTEKEAVVDLGLPRTPRKEGDGHLQRTLLPNTTVALATSGVCQSAQRASAPVADGVCLSPSTGLTSSMRQAVELSSVMVTMDGKTTAKVDLADARKQLMIMGLFPAQLYGAGESFEEMRLRYLVVGQRRACIDIQITSIVIYHARLVPLMYKIFRQFILYS